MARQQKTLSLNNKKTARPRKGRRQASRTETQIVFRQIPTKGKPRYTISPDCDPTMW